MTIEDIRNVFKTGAPFTVYLADGRQFHVKHPDFAAVSPGPSRLMTVYDEQGQPELINLLLISSIKQSSVEKGTPS